MLCLTIKSCEKVQIGDAVISVVRKGSGFKLVIDAPRDVQVLRENAVKRSVPINDSTIAKGVL